jgi:hypothetical protein
MLPDKPGILGGEHTRRLTKEQPAEQGAPALFAHELCEPFMTPPDGLLMQL